MLNQILSFKKLLKFFSLFKNILFTFVLMKYAFVLNKTKVFLKQNKTGKFVDTLLQNSFPS